MNGEQSSQISSYLNYLPAYLQSDPFLAQFLLAFEQILSGKDSGIEPQPEIIKHDASNPRGMEEVIQWISTYFAPQKTPKEFLPWLASWVALSLRDDWNETQKRNFISKIVPFYRLRGTKAGLQAMLKIYLDHPTEEVNIYEFPELPHYFQVELSLATQNLVEYRRKQKVARAIIDQEKPAHTFYALRIKMPTMRIVSEELAKKENIPRLRILKASKDKDGQPIGNTILGTTNV
jgi:phage tail P2-like protein